MSTKQMVQTPFQTGVIDIGAHAVRLDIYELNRNWKSERLETLSRRLSLGTDVFRDGFVSAENVSKLVGIVEKFQQKLREYGAKYFQVVATSALREAFNRELIIDRFRDVGLNLQILDAQREATVTYLAGKEVVRAAKPEAFHRAVMLILGSGSLFVIGVMNDLMCFCEEIPTGFLRVNDDPSVTGSAVEQLHQSLNSQRILWRLTEFMPAKSDEKTTLVIVGNSARKLSALAGRELGSEDECAAFSGKEFAKVLENCRQMSKKYFHKLEENEVAEVSAAAAIIGFFFNQMNCKQILCPGITTRGAVLRDWIRRCREPGEEAFRQDLASVCSAIGKRYDFDPAHAKCVAEYCSVLYGKLRHFYSLPEKSPLLLEAAAYLHDIGRFVDARHHQKHSWYLIANTQLPGVSESEHRIIAAISRYHGKSVPRDTHPEYSALSADEKVAVLKLAAVLRLADALDNRTGTSSMEIKPVIRGKVLKILTDSGISGARRYAVKVKGELFEQVFGLEIKVLENEL